MNRIYQKLAVAVASTTMFAIIGSISKAEAFQLFSDRTQWEAALNAPTKTLDFGEPTVFSGTKVFPNGVSVSTNVNNNNNKGFAEGTTVGLRSSAGSVRDRISVKLPSLVRAVGFDAMVTAYPTEYGSVRPGFISEAGGIVPPGSPLSSGFYGIISEAGDALLTGFSLGSYSPATPQFNAKNISYKSVSVPEGSSTLGILVAFGAFGLGTAFIRRQKQYKLTAID